MITASERTLFVHSDFFGVGFSFFLRRSFLRGTSIHSSGWFEVFGLFSTGFSAANTNGVTVGSLSRLRGSGVDLGAGSGGVWVLSSRTTYFGDLTSFIFCTILSLRWYTKCSMQQSFLFILSFKSCISRSASVLPSLMWRNIFFFVLQKFSIPFKESITFCRLH